MSAKVRIPFADELRMGAWPVSVALFALCSTASLFTAAERPVLLPFVAASALCLALERRWRVAGRAATVIVLALFILWASAFFRAPGLLVLFIAPVLLAGAVLGWTAAGFAAVVSSAAIVAWPTMTGLPADPGVAVLAIALTWLAFGALAMIYHPVYQFAQWAWSYYSKTQQQLAESEQRKLVLEQVTAELAHANEQLTRTNLLAERLHLAAEEARAAKQQFVANVSHELRTPLNMVIGYTDMMLDAPEAYGSGVPPALLADLSVIHRNASHLSELVNDVLDLSQIEADQMALQRDYVAFGEILDSAVGAVQPLFASKKLYLRTQVPDDLPLIFCDATRIREVLLNLLSNAGRFTEQGGVIVHARCERDARYEREMLEVAVEDTGPGIDARDQARLFQPFSQLDASLSRRHGGTGLGLAISRQFIELHGGRMWVESEVGKGATLYFRLPILPAAQGEDPAARWLEPAWEYHERTATPGAPRPKVRPRYLVLDHNDGLIRLLSHYFREAEVERVASVADVAAAPAGGDVFFVNEPSIAEGLARLSREGGAPPGTPTLVCAIAGAGAGAETRGAIERLVKPIARETLLAALKKAGVESGSVLIADDEPDALQLFGRMLASAEPAYRVRVAQSGLEALQSIRHQRPDAILLDLIMPQMDGFQLLAELQQDADLRTIPVIIISARDPMGEPIVSGGLALAHADGISARVLLAAVQFTTQVFGAAAAAAPGLPAASPG